MRMPRSVPSSLLLTLLLPALSPAVRAQTPATAPADSTGTATATAETRTPDRPRRNRVVSDGLAASLAQTMPKYNPPPKPKPEEEGDEPVDLRDVDKPRNKIIRLPKYVVQEPKPAVFRERDIYDKRNRTDLALSRYYGLNFGNVFGLNRPIALAMYQEEERLQNMAELRDTARTVGVASQEDSAYIKRVSDETFMRTSGFGYDSGPK
jgi:hypothetical protein